MIYIRDDEAFYLGNKAPVLVEVYEVQTERKDGSGSELIAQVGKDYFHLQIDRQDGVLRIGKHFGL